ncbi:MAG: FAD binding domain-containing protein, partial [Thiotrichaceae bacterium]|nr:FAD binding domain-containing protein [Thiotrichaceae bacterium]
MADIEYIRPLNLKEALGFLWDNGENTQIIAGGTDVMIDVRSGVLKKKYLLDISRLDELKGIELNDEGLCVGAGVTLSEIYSSDLLELNALALKKTAYHFAGKQIRNIATIG